VGGFGLRKKLSKLIPKSEHFGRRKNPILGVKGGNRKTTPPTVGDAKQIASSSPTA